jgi:hypothetical protein
VLAEVVVGEVVRAGDLPGQEASAERAIRDEADAEFADKGQQLVLGIAGPETVFSL